MGEDMNNKLIVQKPQFIEKDPPNSEDYRVCD